MHQATDPTSRPNPYMPSRAQGWYVVALMTLLLALSFTDRMVLALLAEPVIAAFNLSDGQLALLIGAGFSVVYSVGGLPLADRVDRGNRIVVVVLGVAVWCLMTIGSGFATSFIGLLIMRAGVALGESVLTPAAVSLIADHFPPERRAAPTALYGSMASIMSTGSFLIAGAALAFSGDIEHITHLEPWRMTLVLVGAPGLVVGALFAFTVRDRFRRADRDKPAKSDVSFGAVLHHLGTSKGFYFPFYLGMGLITMVSTGFISWLPTMLIRSHGFNTDSAGLWAGSVGLPAGITAAFLWPFIAERIRRRGRPDGSLFALVFASLLSGAALAFFPWLPNMNFVAVFLYVALIGLAPVAVLVPIALQTYGPRLMRARLTSIYLICTSLIGYALGPLAIVEVAGFWGKQPDALQYGMISTGVVLAIASAICFALSILGARNMASDHG